VSWFVVDPSGAIPRTRVDLGSCACPGTPHENDWIEVADVLTWPDLVDIGTEPSGSEGARRLRAHARAIVAWSFVDGDGRAIPITEDTVRLLSAEALAAIGPALEATIERSLLPPGSGAPSRRSPRGSASSRQTRTAPPGNSS
jgi:hypothetical protein